MTLSIERADRRMGLASDRTVYSSKRNRPLLLYGRLLDDSRPSHGLTATNPDYFLFAVYSGVSPLGIEPAGLSESDLLNSQSSVANCGALH